LWNTTALAVTTSHYQPGEHNTHKYTNDLTGISDTRYNTSDIVSLVLTTMFQIKDICEKHLKKMLLQRND